MTKRTDISSRNLLIVEGNPNFKKGVLFPFHITFGGEEVSLPFALHVLEEIRKDISLQEETEVISRFGNNGEYAILSFDCKRMMQASHSETQLAENVAYKGRVIAKSKCSTLISVNGFYGYTDDITDKELGDIVKVIVTRNSSNKLCFCKFSILEADGDETSEENAGMSEEIEQFLTEEEFSALKEEQKKEIEWVLENIEGTTRRNINVVREVLHLTYNPMNQTDLITFLTAHPHYFDEHNFWIGAYRDNASNEVKLIIYDCQDIVLEIQVNESGMQIQEFSHDRNKSNAQFLLDKNQKALVIAGSNIRFHDGLLHSEDNVKKGERILRQLNVARDILFDLKKGVRTLKEQAGIDYITLKDYLTYQEGKEREYYKKNSVRIAGNQADITTAISSDKTALFVFYMPELADLFSEQDGDECHIEITCTEKPINAVMKYNREQAGYTIEFFTEHLDIEGLRREGFEVRRKAGVRHLLLQKDSIHDFVYGEGQSDVFEKLNGGKLVSPVPDETIQFFDPKFSNVEEGNNQPLAIRKAVNNKDIFLIQGPPGTGKTSVIVEIIKQLVIHRQERVLVCSQAHSAVKNIYDRLVDTDDRIRIGFLDEEETMIPDDLEEHPEYLKNNMLLLQNLGRGESADSMRTYCNNLEYKTRSKDIFKKEHQHIIDYYPAAKLGNTMEWLEILSDLKQGLSDLDKQTAAFNNARHFQGLNVVMGTCIGLGLNKALKNSGVRFDTVIIDEAGKANLAETTVPMQLGRKYILVGDNKQLPPYMDTQEIDEFVRNGSSTSQDVKSVQNAIGSSLFEDFLNDSKFPAESTVLLNYQYRMNPEIGDYISELFYKEALKNGRGTEKQTCKLRSFPSAVTFIDTSSTDRYKAYEKGSAKEGWYNPEEIAVFRDRMLPRLKEVMAEEPDISVGIITPYRKQREYLLREVKGTTLENSIYTIDSIQGSEFDIVVLSLVRAFDTGRGNRTVGFLDDMRRLNVALSRAKKKLIIIGNLDTLCNDKAHDRNKANLSIEPTEVFRKLRSIQDRTAERTSLDILMQKMEKNQLKIGDVFSNCTWEWEGPEGKSNLIYIHIEVDGKTHTFRMKTDDEFKKYGMKERCIDVTFLGLENDRAHFRFKPSMSVAEMMEEGVIKKAKARLIEWTDDRAKDEALFVFEDESEGTFSIFEGIWKEHILFDLLESKHTGFISLYFDPDAGTVSLDKQPYNRFAQEHQAGEKVTVQVIDDTCSETFYIVACGEVYGRVHKRFAALKRGQVIEAEIFRINKQSINFNIPRR